MRRFLIICLCLALPALGQAALTVTKSLDDAVLTWIGGTGPYSVIRSDSLSMTTRT